MTEAPRYPELCETFDCKHDLGRGVLSSEIMSGIDGPYIDPKDPKLSVIGAYILAGETIIESLGTD